ncbi:hypothetical protein P3W75_06750 [Pseudomonas citronellolis]|nr:hypothetical protein [Pseudomonas citronellolis]MDF3932317.1 hypothetical protein [Pseudomonas citronellolis]
MAARDSGAGAAWGEGAALDARHAGGWNDVPRRDQQQASAWGQGAALDAGAGSRWDTVPRKDLAVVTAWDRSIRARDVRLRLLYNPLPAWRDTTSGQAWNRCDEFGQRFDSAAERAASLYVPTPGLVEFSFGGARYVPNSAPVVFFEFSYTAPTHALQPVDSGAVVRFTPARIVDQMRRLPWGWGTPTDPKPTGIVYPDYPGTVVVIDPPQEPDVLETYMIANAVTLTVLPSGTPLDATSIRVGLDIDSFAWSFSAELFGRTSLNLVRPDAQGPKTVELTINGWTWRFLVDHYSGSGKHPSERYSIGGSSRTQLLAEPYAPRRAGANVAVTTARQAVDEQLRDTGFEVNWDSQTLGPPDWTFPAGAFSYQGQTPMQVVARIAEVAGGVVHPSLAEDAFWVAPRYREPTWNWSDAVMDRIIPVEVVAEWGSQWSPQPAWNSVYVSGSAYGVAAQIRRAGTAGDIEAPEVMEDWVTGLEAARSRGVCELSKGGDQAVVTLRIPLFAKGETAPGLIEPTMLCEVRDTDESWRGLCLGVEVSAEGVGASRVWQTLRLERHYEGDE